MPPEPDKAARSRFPAIIKAIGLLAIVGLVVSIPYLSRGLAMSLDKPTVSKTRVGSGPTTSILSGPSGKFRLEYRLFGFDSDGTGGACLIADIERLVPANNVHYGEIHRGNCTKPEECNLKGLPPPPGVWEGYCVPDGPNQLGRCWYRPADPDPKKKGLLCHTSGNHPTDPPDKRGTPWSIGVDHEVPFTPGFNLRDFYEDHTGGHPTQWRLSGLLFARLPDETRRPYFGDPACLSVDQKKC